MCSDFQTNATVSDKTAGLGEHRFSAYPKVLLRTIGIDAAEGEIQEWLAGCDLCL